jgi:CRP/FNR family transcriptional regulator, cyclic AMP receptor protein
MAEDLAAPGKSKRPEFAALLGMNPLFAGLGEQAITAIAGLCTKRNLDSGEVLFQKGDKGDALYGVRRGRVRIETGTAAGGRLALNVLGPGDLFGEIALFDGQPRTADAIAAEPSELFMVRRSDFLAYLEREPRITIRLLEMLCQRIRWVSDRMEEAVLLPLHARLARRLCALADDFGSEVHISQEELGTYVGAARESVNRQLQEWRRAGIIDLARGRISLLDIERLNAAASGE